MVLNKQCYNKWLVNHALLISYGTFPCSRRKMDIKSELNGLTFQWLTTASLLPNALVFSFSNMWDTVRHFIMKKKKSIRERAQKASPRHTSNTCTRTPRIEKNYHTQIDAHNQLTQGKGVSRVRLPNGFVATTSSAQSQTVVQHATQIYILSIDHKSEGSKEL